MTLKYEVHSKGDFITKLLSLLSFLHAPLTDTEVLVLKTFLCLPPKYRYHRFSSAGRKAAIKMLAEEGIHLSSANLNNRLYALLDKKYLRRDEDKVIYTADFLEKIIDIYLQHGTFSFTLNFIETRQDTALSTAGGSSAGHSTVDGSKSGVAPIRVS